MMRDGLCAVSASMIELCKALVGERQTDRVGAAAAHRS